MKIRKDHDPVYCISHFHHFYNFPKIPCFLSCLDQHVLSYTVVGLILLKLHWVLSYSCCLSQLDGVLLFFVLSITSCAPLAQGSQGPFIPPLWASPASLTATQHPLWDVCPHAAEHWTFQAQCYMVSHLQPWIFIPNPFAQITSVLPHYSFHP
jgi:hypothetical protein